MIVHGEGETLVPAHLHFGKFILDRLKKAKADEICLVNCDTNEKLTYGELTAHATRLATALAALGARRGLTVAVAGEPRAAFLPTTLAVIFTGATVTPIELECGRAVLVHKLNLTRPNYVICSRLFWDEYSQILKGLDYIKTFICFDDIEEIELCVTTLVSRNVDVTAFEPAAVSGATDVAMVVYSSGTTGASKGVMLTHLNCIVRMYDSKKYFNFESLRTGFFPGDIYSGYFTIILYSFLSAEKKIVYSEKEMDPQILQDYQVDTIPTIPAGVEELLNMARANEYDLSSLKIVYTCSGPLSSKLSEELAERYPNIKLLEWYGATEISLLTARQPGHTETNNIGVAAPGVTLKVVDVETRAILGPNQRGEICARSPGLMKGYLGTHSQYLDNEGFYLTGDLGYYDDYKRFYFVDRLKDVINYMGFKLSPGEVEAVLLRHSAVREAAVVGRPAGARGEQPAAFVVLQPRAAASEAELQDYVAREVTWYMRLTGGVRFVPELPRNARGKVLRRQLLEMLALE